MADIRHIIERQVLEVQAFQSEDGLEFQQRLREVYYQALLPRMEELFDRHTASGELLRLEKLELEIILPASKDWETAFVNASLQQLKISLTEHAEAGVSRMDDVPGAGQILGGKDAVTTLLYFLQRGIRPWYGISKSQAELEKEILGSDLAESFRTRLWPLIHDEVTVRDRTILQCSDAFLAQVFSGTALEFLKAWTLQHASPLSEDTVRVFFWRAVLDSETAGSVSAAQIQQRALRRYLQQYAHPDLESVCTGLPDPVRKQVRALLETVAADDAPVPTDDKDSRSRKPGAKMPAASEPGSSIDGERPFKEGDFLFIENAGLVLMHPFLAPFFERVQLCLAGSFINQETQQRAVLLTQYIVRPEEEIPEYALTLNKLLCGYPVEQTLASRITVSGEESAEIGDLLKTVTDHWKMRGVAVNTTADHLRMAFLQRPGKLTRRTHDWLLQVEQKSYDIVLSGLPWGIARIRCPWMADTLCVEWN